jgi:hypothetical protein
MRKNKLKLVEQINRINELFGNDAVSGKHLCVVDIQPEYEKAFGNMLPEFIDFLNENYGNLGHLTFFYNGYDTLGMISEGDYKMWWLDNGLEEHIVYGATFYDKGYAFFRYCIDEGIDDEQIVNIVKYMVEKNVNDSRDLDKDFWNEFIERYGNEDIRELLEFAGDAINIPDLMDELSGYKGVVICGGGINECLKEVEIALDSLGTQYTVLSKYTY